MLKMIQYSNAFTFAPLMAGDQIRRNHSAQYVSYPNYPWQKTLQETPNKYKSYVDLVAGAWTKVRIEIAGTQARLYVHDAEQPTLLINDLKLEELSEEPLVYGLARERKPTSPISTTESMKPPMALPCPFNQLI
jgi:hypothetical protein